MIEKNIIRLPVVAEDGDSSGNRSADILGRMIEPEFVTILGD
jgi:hypothetical protein